MREPNTFRLVFCFCAALAACAGGQTYVTRPATKVECGPLPPEAAGRPFDRGAAAQALGQVPVHECRRQGGPEGSARVEVTVCPDGETRGATVIEAEFDDVETTRCIEAKFNAVRMPPFDVDGGAPVHVKKSMTLTRGR